ncbi:uncharacterized protein DUF2798 [Kineothrix alysoides]|uniref:Uncharacterized protein DUF2798 n=1 Tax=Kineothrix alysoides TaxID=1469948 RepID=A0A4R1QZG1_9FIRM|nr:DUF2798 domain-containing protein [Kineothrix alysoides]TCL58376.1 uncharacterized protein DUF2798 [Kineothrix alysoides]
MFTPKTRIEKTVFGVLMASVMVYGMETYNTALLHGGMTNSFFLLPLSEFLGFVVIVMVLQEFIGGPIARKMAFRLVNPSSDKPLTVTLMIQAMTVCVMCPMMSMVASLLFKGIDIQIPAKWVQAVIINFPMAFFWQIFVAGPLVRFISRILFVRPQSN